MSRYVDRKGGLVVEKVEPEQTSAPPLKAPSANKSVVISGQDVIDTLQSYQTGNFSFLDSSEKGVCLICGKQTAAKNRHICVDCWKENKDEIIDGLKTAVKDVELKID